MLNLFDLISEDDLYASIMQEGDATPKQVEQCCKPFEHFRERIRGKMTCVHEEYGVMETLSAIQEALSKRTTQ